MLGYSNGRYDVSPLDTFKILWICDPDIGSGHPTKETLISPMDKTITCLQEPSPPKTPPRALSRPQVAKIRIFLDMQESDTRESNLIRCVVPGQFVLWICQSNVNQRFDQAAQKDLEEFVLGHERNVEMHHSTLRVDLTSSDEADLCRTLLIAVKYVFEISIKLNLEARKSYARDFRLDIAKMSTIVLELDGNMLDIHSHGHVRHSESLFTDQVMSNQGLQLITLFNYPRPQEQCIQYHQLSLQPARSSSSAILSRRWVDLKENLCKFHGLVSDAQTASNCDPAIGVLQ